MVNSLDLRDKPQDLSGGQKSAITLVMAMAPDIPIPEFRSPEIHIPASGVHLVKSICCRQPLQKCCLSNSSEKISASLPQLGHLQTKDFRYLICSNPGQCWGVVISSSLG
jgi:hypothetical protein